MKAAPTLLMLLLLAFSGCGAALADPPQSSVLHAKLADTVVSGAETTNYDLARHIVADLEWDGSHLGGSRHAARRKAIRSPRS